MVTSRAYSIHHVPKTNLMLLVVDALCYCTDMTINAEPIELSHILYLRLLLNSTDIF